jgi:hypothetical protein
MAISLTCALLATLLHQWARRYLTITQPVRCSPHKRARIRAFFAEGVESLHVNWAVEALPILLHLALFSFLAGLLLFLFNINQTAFIALFSWVALSAGLYACITLMPIFRYDSPYYAPLSSTAWFLYAGMLYVIFRILCFIPRRRDAPDPLRERKDRYRKWAGGGVEKAAVDTAAEQSSKIDRHVLDWTTEALGEDEALERFFEAIPGFGDSKEVRVRVPTLLQMKIRQVMDGFLDRTLRSEFISESVKLARLTNCLNAAHTALGTFAVSRILGNIFDGRWRDIPHSIELGHSLRRWCQSGDEWIALTARSIVASIIAVRERDDRWIELVKDQFGLSSRVLRDNIPYGDSVMLVILLHVTRNLFRNHNFHSVFPPWDSNILRVLSRFNIHNTLPHLQRDFCILWNEIVRDARNRRPDDTPVFILREIRELHGALHGGTNVASDIFSSSPTPGDDTVRHPSSYPLCNAVPHRSDPTPRVHGALGRQPTRTSVITLSAVPTSGPSSPIPAVPTPGPSSPISGIPSHPALSRRLSNQHPTEPPSSDVTNQPRRFFIDTSALSPSPESQPASPDIAAAPSTPGTTDISTTPLMAQPSPHPSNGADPQRNEETTMVPSSVVSAAVVPPIPTQSSSSSGEIPAEPPSTSESHLPLAPQVASPSDDPVAASIETEHAQHDTGGPSSPTPTRIELPRSPHQSASADLAASTPPPEDRQHDLDQS